MQFDFDHFLKKVLDEICPNSSPFRQYVNYALEGGKRFRPQLIFSYANDAQIKTNEKKFEDLCYWATAIEIHHNYTLIHDDLPSMDNDDIRRGRATLHKYANEWIAILTGDLMLSMSYRCLDFIQCSDINLLRSHFFSLTASNGLLLGQFMDLDEKFHHQIEKIHQLKTANLISLSLYGASIIDSNTKIEKQNMNFEELGLQMGLNFQLMDDLSDFHDEDKSLNSFKLDIERSITQANLKHEWIMNFLTENKLNSLKELYLQTMNHFLDKSNETQIKKRLHL